MVRQRASKSDMRAHLAAASSPARGGQFRRRCAGACHRWPAGARRARGRPSAPPAAPQWPRRPAARGGAPSPRLCGTFPPAPAAHSSPPPALFSAAQTPAPPNQATPSGMWALLTATDLSLVGETYIAIPSILHDLRLLSSDCQHR